MLLLLLSRKARVVPANLAGRPAPDDLAVLTKNMVLFITSKPQEITTARRRTASSIN